VFAPYPLWVDSTREFPVIGTGLTIPPSSRRPVRGAHGSIISLREGTHNSPARNGGACQGPWSRVSDLGGALRILETKMSRAHSCLLMDQAFHRTASAQMDLGLPQQAWPMSYEGSGEVPMVASGVADLVPLREEVAEEC
jgi:hypothetical protein